MSAHSELARLLEHPAIWRGTSVARAEVLSSGFDALDERLPGGGWPRSGLVEILTPRLGVGELTLFLPLLRALTSALTARSTVWVNFWCGNSAAASRVRRCATSGRAACCSDCFRARW